MSDDIEAIKRDIVATRARLNASVEALAYRANVPARARDLVDTKIDSIKTSLFGAIGAGRRAVAGGEQAATRIQAMATSASRNAATLGRALGEPLQHFTDLRPRAPSSKGQPEFMRAFLARNPLGFALTAVAIGLLIGFVLPISEIERDTVGPLGQQLIDDATSAASDVIDQGKAVVATIVGEA